MTDEEARLAAHLQKFVQCKTVSNMNVDKYDWGEFEKLHAAFKAFYPHIFAEMEVEKVGRAGLQFCLKADHPVKKPLLLMAHQDVVETGDLSKWNFPPFEGQIIDGCLCGRGCTDCKVLCLSELEAVEALLAKGYRPDYDLYISLGYSEEVYLDNDVDGAELLVRNLEKKGVRLGAVIDEGGAMDIGPHGELLARIGLQEKASVNYEIYMDTPGGHSCTPGHGTALGQIAQAIVNIEQHPFPYRLTPLAILQLKAQAPYVAAERQALYADPEGHWKELQELADSDKVLDAMFHTTVAFTMAAASAQPNVLPSRASAQVNVRILEGDTVQSVMDYFQALLPEGVKIRNICGPDPMPAAPVDSHLVKVTEKVLKDMYGDKVHIIPFLMLGCTDSRFYKRITDSQIMFGGLIKDGRWGAAHMVNEKLPVDALPKGVEFITRIIENY